MEHLQTLSESRLGAPVGEAPAFSRSAPSRTIVHAKLEMTTPGDFDESDADFAADDIASGRPLKRAITGRAGDGSGLAFPSALESTLLSQKGGGISLPSVTLKSMGQAFGQDFSQVRIHADSTAARLSKSIAARAFTHGNDIFFNQGQYNPASNEGRRLLAHELAHVVQKSGKIARDTDHAEQTRIVHDFFVSNWNWGLFYTYLNSYHPSVVKQLGLKLNDGFFFRTNWEKERGIGFLKEVSEGVVYDFHSKKKNGISSLSPYDDAIKEFRLLEMIYQGSIAPAFSALLTLTQNQRDKAKTHSDYASHSSIEETKEAVANVGNRKVDFKGTLFDNRDEPIKKMYTFLKNVYPDALSYYNPFKGFFGGTESIDELDDLNSNSMEFAEQVEKYLDEFITKRYKDYLKKNNLNPSRAEEKEEARYFLSLFEKEVAQHARSYEAAGVLLSIVRCRQKTVYSMDIHTPKCLVSAEAWTQLFVDIMIQGGTMLLGGPLVGKIVSNVVIKNPLAKKVIVETSKRAMDAVAGATDETLRQMIHHENLDGMAILKEAGMSAVYGKVMDETLKIGAKGYKALKNRPKLDEPLTNPQLVPDKRMLDLSGGNQPLMLNNLQPKPHTPQKSLIESPSPKQPAPEPGQTPDPTGKPDVEMKGHIPNVPTTKMSFNDADLLDADIIRPSTPGISTSKPAKVPKPNQDVAPKPNTTATREPKPDAAPQPKPKDQPTITLSDPDFFTRSKTVTYSDPNVHLQKPTIQTTNQVFEPVKSQSMPLGHNHPNPKAQTPQNSLVESPPQKIAPEPSQASVPPDKTDVIAGRPSTPEISTLKANRIPELIATPKPNKPVSTALEPEVPDPLPIQKGSSTPKRSVEPSNPGHMPKAEVDLLNKEGIWKKVSDDMDIYIPNDQLAKNNKTTNKHFLNKDEQLLEYFERKLNKDITESEFRLLFKEELKRYKWLKAILGAGAPITNLAISSYRSDKDPNGADYGTTAISSAVGFGSAFIPGGPLLAAGISFGTTLASESLNKLIYSLSGPESFSDHPYKNTADVVTSSVLSPMPFSYLLSAPLSALEQWLVWDVIPGDNPQSQPVSDEASDKEEDEDIVPQGASAPDPSSGVPDTLDTSPESNDVLETRDNNTEKEEAIPPSPPSLEELNQQIVDATKEALSKMDIEEDSSSVKSALGLINLAKGQSEPKKTDNNNKSTLTKVKARALADKVRDRASFHNKNKHPSLSKEYYSIAAYLYDLAAKKSRTKEDREDHKRLAEQCRKKAS